VDVDGGDVDMDSDADPDAADLAYLPLILEFSVEILRECR
jgi:hypothetical protein